MQAQQVIDYNIPCADSLLVGTNQGALLLKHILNVMDIFI